MSLCLSPIKLIQLTNGACKEVERPHRGKWDGQNYSVEIFLKTAGRVDGIWLEREAAENINFKFCIFFFSFCVLAVSTMSNELVEDETRFYCNAQTYWKNVPPTVDGMLGGYGHISSIDISGSKKFLQRFLRVSRQVYTVLTVTRCTISSPLRYVTLVNPEIRNRMNGGHVIPNTDCCGHINSFP